MILEALLSIKEPIAALQLHSFLQRQRKVLNKVTIYRELKFLSDLGMVHPVYLKDGVVRYEIAPERGHRHHLVCTICKCVKDVDVECERLHAMEEALAKKNRFTMRGHSLEFYGLCSKCL